MRTLKYPDTGKYCLSGGQYARIKTMSPVSLLLFLLAICTSQALFAQDWSWLDNSRVALDSSYRGMSNSRGDGYAGMQFVGVDAHKVFTGSKGDVGTLLFQVYATTLHDMEQHPGLFRHKDDTQVIYRNVNFNYTAPFGRALNFRVGHFEVPVGIEQIIDTNGTLRDYNHGRNIGVKGDWGASINGESNTLEYEVAWTRGSGNEWETLGDPGLFSGRVATLRNNNWVLGLSFLDGEVFSPNAPNHTLERTRFGVDAHWYWRRFEVMTEAFIGDDAGDAVRNSFVEFNYRARDATWFVYTQLRRFELDTDVGEEKATSAAIGIEFEPDNHWNFSAELNHDFELMGAGMQGHLLRAQLRYRFQ